MEKEGGQRQSFGIACWVPFWCFWCISWVHQCAFLYSPYFATPQLPVGREGSCTGPAPWSRSATCDCAKALSLSLASLTHV